jgi:hypothetical protein
MEMSLVEDGRMMSGKAKALMSSLMEESCQAFGSMIKQRGSAQ